MNVEVYSYSLFTTVLGMLVVFLSLTALSVMMVVLKAVFIDKAKVGGGARKRKDRNAKSAKAKVAEGLQTEAGEGMPVWVPAALAAYLAEEQEPDRPTADPWNAVVNQYDPWIVGGRISKRGV
jgi:hypothetical protein